MKNIDIVKAFESEEMSKFLAACALDSDNWDDKTVNYEWLEKENTDGELYKGPYVWNGSIWDLNTQSGEFDKYKHAGNWVLNHLVQILEAVLATDKITGYRVLVVIPTIETSSPTCEDFADNIYYKGIRFKVWSDFFDLNTSDMSIEEGDRATKEYLNHMEQIQFTHINLAGSIRVFFRNN